MSPSYDPRRVRAAYDTVAASYDVAFGDELDQLPFDAALVDRLGAEVAGAPILELGAGVAPVARRLRTQQVVACDLSAAMLAHAPTGGPRVQADARRLPFRDGAFGAACLRYVLQHVDREEQPFVVAELRRVLRPGALALVAVHVGDGEVELGELLGHRFEPIGGTFHGNDQLRELLSAGGFAITEEHERGPVAGEADTRRLYVFAAAR